MSDMIVAIVVTALICLFFGWSFGFIAFLYRYKRTERCYLCDCVIETKELLACDECNAYGRSLSDRNLALELSKVTKRLNEVEVYRLEGLIETWKNRERYQEINETIVCSDEFMTLLRQLLVDNRFENSLNIKHQKEGKSKPKPKYIVT